ncbi:MAG: hypothetical protein EPN91_13045 [Salinibacterium sp.]|nr:MAG: hypothetical protein EPN91_13045 [Salinibacterium sp.]
MMISNELMERRVRALAVAHKGVAGALDEVCRAARERDRGAMGRAITAVELARERLAEAEAAVGVTELRAPMHPALARVRDAIPHGELPADPTDDEVASAAARLVSRLPVVTEERDELENRLSRVTLQAAE